jgi:hypothetical protein
VIRKFRLELLGGLFEQVNVVNMNLHSRPVRCKSIKICIIFLPYPFFCGEFGIFDFDIVVAEYVSV